MTFSEGLKRFRKERKLTQREVAQAANVLIQTYQVYEYGRDPAISVLAKIADAFNVSIDYLVGRSDNPQRL